MFRNLKGKTKTNLENIRRILNYLDKCINNTELSRLLWHNLNSCLNEKRYYIELTTKDEVLIKRKKSNNEFHIIFTPSLEHINTIGIHLVTENGAVQEDIFIQFKDDIKQVIVTRHKIEKKFTGKKNDQVESIINSTTVRNYLDGAYRYEYQYKTETCYRISLNYSAATIMETFVDLDNTAVRRVAHISEDSYYDNPAEIVYYESSNFVHPPFNDQNYNRSVEENMEFSTEEKFKQFTDTNNNKVNLRVKKKMD